MAYDEIPPPIEPQPWPYPLQVGRGVYVLPVEEEKRIRELVKEPAPYGDPAISIAFLKSLDKEI